MFKCKLWSTWFAVRYHAQYRQTNSHCDKAYSKSNDSYNDDNDDDAATDDDDDNDVDDDIVIVKASSCAISLPIWQY